ncbi:GNAT family N-acetyltransferase [Macrococcus brunensis]|uniref:GNAT family N-acetyltransferase n=1 Tax=Macrococcus brunensis TaxID=198483 RepID=A0A4R6BE56_9STAP|nr:GNAT family N-acetyltransferase [Macrococcus brunensis]TDL98052.1 GNAT family N-acetyltransferase [Macrococcus brunensis]ULG72313.1 GNAT family N-acetyltransferase [Macrococcus brunensis]ULG74573.1 GNAT family N-acetyltransferase [Macrococcus brunensis]
MEILIRRLNSQDVQELQTISIETFKETFEADNSEEHMVDYLRTAYDLDKLTAELNNRDSYFYFAETKDGTAGYLKLNKLDAQSEDMGSDALEVERIYVRSAFHRQGIGKVLMKKAYDVAVEKEKSKVWLGVWEHNHKARAFYEAQGFVKTGEHVFMMGDDAQTDYIYEKTL